MADEHHSWHLGEEPPFIRPHSQAKHRVIAGYLTQYVATLSSNFQIPELRITLVDGFAGGGRYRDKQTGEHCDGSPLLMLKAMQEAEAVGNISRDKPFRLDAKYYFIESSRDTFPYLKATLELSEFRDQLHNRIELINGKFIDNVDSIIRAIQHRKGGNRAIFVLDQFGYLDVPFSAIQSILTRLKRAEIILTFAANSLIDYLSEKDKTQKILESLGLQLSKDSIRTAKQEADWRLAIQQRLHKEIFVRSGAKHYTPFFIRSKEAHRDYWLIHLSNHARARDVMVGLHWKEHAGFAHYGKPGLAMLGYDQDRDTKLSGQEFLFDNSAQTLTHEHLLDQLPERVSLFSDGVEFKSLFAHITNETPATSSIIANALNTLRSNGEIEIRDKYGKRTRRINHSSDVIQTARQKLFFGPDT